MTDQSSFRLLDSPSAELGEGPVWDALSQTLVWVDITQRRLFRYWSADDRVEAHVLGSAIGAAALTVDDTWVLALEDGFWTADIELQKPRHLNRPAALVPGLRMNDGKVDPWGRFWAGSMAYDGTPGVGELYRLDPDGGVTVVLRGLGISNGLDWSPDGRSFYFIDSLDSAIYSFALEPASGVIRDRRTLLKVPASQGMPDGLTVDSDGHIWVAFWGGSAVRRYDPSGVLEQTITLPVKQVTSCTFGGAKLDQLFVTTAAFQLTAEQKERQPLAGRVFRLEPGVTGLARRRFGRDSQVAPR
ncbi:MAG: SMP-30/gluconolactonase/LRE family protein [Actinomycetota bacterium]|nr:SMP-30/gluconolactonase/LRE family protein [Actinomycetota bacterium]